MGNIVQLVKDQENLFNTASNSDVVLWQKESQFAIQAMQKNNFLEKTALNNPTSVQNAIINVSAIGISLNPANKHAYLVPRDGMVCLDVSYIGLMHLAVTSGAIQWGQAKLVYANDNYVNNGIDKAPTHTQNTFGDKGEIVGVYCTVKLKSGDYLTEEMDMNAIEAVKKTSKSLTGNGAKYSPWNTFPEEMMRKTVVKRASKYWHCESLNKAVEVVNEHEGLSSEYTQTAPQIQKYSPDQKRYFDQLIEESDAIGMAVLKLTIDEDLYISLTHSFKQGVKGKYGQIVMDLAKKGIEEIEAYTSIFEDNLGDDSATLEILDEIKNPRALDIILGKVSSEVEMYVRGLGV